MVRTIVSVDRVTTESDDPYIVTDEAVVQQNIENLLVTWFGYEADEDEEGLFYVDDVDQFKTRVDAVAGMAEGDIEFTITVLDTDEAESMSYYPTDSPPSRPADDSE